MEQQNVKCSPAASQIRLEKSLKKYITFANDKSRKDHNGKGNTMMHTIRVLMMHCQQSDVVAIFNIPKCS